MAKGILAKGYNLNNRYEVLLFIKESTNAETYRVRGIYKKLYVLKLFNYSKLNRSAFDEEGNILEIKFLETINHPNLVHIKESGELIVEGKKFAFLVLDFIPGETLAERIIREPFNSLYDIKKIAIGILKGLEYLHTKEESIIHNEITPQNVMLDMSNHVLTPRIIDFGYARSYHQSTKSYSRAGLNLNHVANECFNNFFSPQSDIFSVGVIMYQLIYGIPPWFRDISQFESDRNKLEEIILKERSKTLEFKDVSNRIIDFDADIIPIIEKALEIDADERYNSAKEFIDVLEGELAIEDLQSSKKIKSDEVETKQIKTTKGTGKGFDAIAGMDALKEELRISVINALHNPEEYAKYGVTIPNGMLLYGPPGCGKTFFAKHFAEEVGFNFMLATPSTLKSRYVNATQENIAKMFEEAEKNAPTIIFIDEINELLPNRDSEAHEMSKSAVNEMLAQMDRTGEKGIFIIGATNYPGMIDPAIMRAGRLDKKFYLSPPDFAAREQMFKLYLKNRPLDFGMNYNKLAELTENFVSADIEYLVNEASRKALVNKERISMKILEDTIANASPSVSLSELKKYEQLKADLNTEKGQDGSKKDDSEPRRRIGFK